MNKRQRIHAAIQGQPVDRPPVALWRHFPQADQDATALARAHLDFQAKYDWDFIKVTPASGYAAEDWGLRAEYQGNREGTRVVLDHPVKSPADWRKIAPLDVRKGVLGRELAALRQIRVGSGPETPVLATIFSPLSIAKNLGRDRLLHDLRHHPADLHAALKVIAQTTARFAVACLENGADAIFFATQFASLDLLTEEEYREFGLPYDAEVLAAIQGKADFVLLHAHGKRPMFDLLATYPVQAINWHDRRTSPSLAEGQKRFRGAVVGGLDEWEALQDGPAAAIEQVREAMLQTGGQRFILAPGCVIPIDTPEENIRAVRMAVEPQNNLTDKTTTMFVDQELDLRGQVCPYTFVKTKLALEEMVPGQVLRVIVDYPPAVQNVPQSVRLQGDEVLSVRKTNATDWEIIIRKSQGL